MIIIMTFPILFTPNICYSQLTKPWLQTDKKEFEKLVELFPDGKSRLSKSIESKKMLATEEYKGYEEDSIITGLWAGTPEGLLETRKINLYVTQTAPYIKGRYEYHRLNEKTDTGTFVGRNSKNDILLVLKTPWVSGNNFIFIEGRCLKFTEAVFKASHEVIHHVFYGRGENSDDHCQGLSRSYYTFENLQVISK